MNTIGAVCTHSSKQTGGGSGNCAGETCIEQAGYGLLGIKPYSVKNDKLVASKYSVMHRY